MKYNLINIYQASGGTLFDDITLYNKIDKDTLINTIFDEAGLLMPITSYPDLLHSKIKVFFMRNYTNFKHIMDAFLLEYEPIENYNRVSDITVKQDGTNKLSKSDTGTITDAGNTTQTNDLKNVKEGNVDNTETRALKENGGSNGTKSGTNANTETDDTTAEETKNDTSTKAIDGTDTTTNSVSPMNVTGYLAKDRAYKELDNNESTTDTTSDTVKNTGTVKNDGTTSETFQDFKENNESGTITNEGDTSETESQTGTVANENSNTQTRALEGSENGEHSETTVTTDRTHGNIGVTTSQQMLQSEIDLWTAFNAYKAMADVFIKELMITVY